MKYANYGNIYINGDWVPTDKPVKLCENKFNKNIFLYLFYY